MKYRDAKNLQKGDKVTRKDGKILTVESIELYGQFKKVKVNCQENVSVFNEEIF